MLDYIKFRYYDYIAWCNMPTESTRGKDRMLDVLLFVVTVSIVVDILNYFLISLIH